MYVVVATRKRDGLEALAAIGINFDFSYESFKSLCSLMAKRVGPLSTSGALDWENPQVKIALIEMPYEEAMRLANWEDKDWYKRNL